ncbi:MAG: DNA methyltransferase [Candidatus Accumulibacter sp.]|jgi:hypothetical protein|nr:DNA methyltransferase [Accumulibacter sp.]
MTPEQILASAFASAHNAKATPLVPHPEILARLEYVCHCASNRAGVRLLMACLLGKLDRPRVDPRKPYTEIGSEDSFSGRTYDERYLTPFIHQHQLPVNLTTAFLTPTLRNIDQPLVIGRELIGRPRDLYQKTLELLDDVAERRISGEVMLAEVLRQLLMMRDERRARMDSLLVSLRQQSGSLALSSEAIVNLVRQHLACNNSSRLPVLVVAAAYQAAGSRLAETILPLQSHNAADRQTGALGDIEICLADDDAVVTVYEMKMRRVTQDDVDAALVKIARMPHGIDNYLFVTTDEISPQVCEYAATVYEKTEGVEIAVLDCLGFLRHFLHFFHRLRMDYLNAYQELLLSEPDSAVRPALKEAFLALRQAAECPEN